LTSRAGHEAGLRSGRPTRGTAPATSTSTGPVAVARVARALTYLVYAFVLVALTLLLFGFFSSCCFSARTLTHPSPSGCIAAWHA
jgi:hypothetical protein